MVSMGWSPRFLWSSSPVLFAGLIAQRRCVALMAPEKSCQVAAASRVLNKLKKQAWLFLDDTGMTIQVEVNSVLFSSFVYDGRKTKPPQLLAPTFRHAKGSFHTLLLGWALPPSLRDFSYQAFLSGLLPRAGSWCNDDNDLVGQLDFLELSLLSAIIKQGLRVLKSWNPCSCGIVCQKSKHWFLDVAQMSDGQNVLRSC